MGALHRGHESLIRIAREQCDVVIVTIFVNPRQFNDPSDLLAYPSTPEDDLAVCESAGADVVATPLLAEMWPDYPAATATTVSVSGLADRFEGEQRPGHFDGVASVVAKLFSITGPCTAYFGDKDFQQLAIVRRMATDLAMAVTVVGCAIVRDEDGLALSSRNVRLSGTGREKALGLSRALRALDDGVLRSADEARAIMATVLDAHGVQTAYAEIVRPDSLEPFSASDDGPARALIAGIVDGVRLLDNGPVMIRSAKGT
jgi:pantoate--beta-alanine ligase